MFEELGFESLSAARASLIFAIGLGILFGIFSERVKFCFRRALIGEDRRQAAGVWAMAVLIAVLGTQYFVAIEVISFDDHRFMNNFSLAQAVVGGLAFGAGMVLTRGCVGRLTVLASTGNLRAVTALLIFAITAHAALKGAFAPVRTTLSSVGPTFDAVSLASVIGSELSLLAIADRCGRPNDNILCVITIQSGEATILPNLFSYSQNIIRKIRKFSIKTFHISPSRLRVVPLTTIGLGILI